MNRELYLQKHVDIKKRLMEVELPENLNIESCFYIGKELGCSGNTVRNYLHGKIGDGYLAEAILAECKRMKFHPYGKKK